MTELNVSFRPLDQARAARLALAYALGDSTSFHAVLTEVMGDPDPAAQPSAWFATVALAARLAVNAMPNDYDVVLRRSIAQLLREQDAVDSD